MSLYVPIIVISVVLVAFYAWYVAIVSRRNKALQALSSIDVQLKMRLDLVPNILRVAKKFMTHEKSLLSEITQLREQTKKDYDKKDEQAVKEHLKAAEDLTAKMGQLMIQVEDYPELKSDKTMVQAMQTYNEVEAQISAARRFYNAAVTSLNNAVQIFPGNLIANVAGVKEMPFFEAEQAAHIPVAADQHLE